MNSNVNITSSKLGELGFILGNSADLLEMLLDNVERNAPGKQWSESENATRSVVFGHNAPYIHALALASSKMIKEVRTEIEKIEKLFECAELQGSESA